MVSTTHRTWARRDDTAADPLTPWWIVGCRDCDWTAQVCGISQTESRRYATRRASEHRAEQRTAA